MGIIQSLYVPEMLNVFIIVKSIHIVMHVGHYYVMLDNALLYDQIFDVLSMLHHFHLLTSVHLM